MNEEYSNDKWSKLTPPEGLGVLPQKNNNMDGYSGKALQVELSALETMVFQLVWSQVDLDKD